METVAYIDAVALHGSALADTAERAHLDLPVPDCPRWTVRSVLEHTGTVHRWATRHVREGRAAPETSAPVPDLPDDALIDWFRTGHRDLVTALRESDDDLDAYRFLHDAPPPRIFWARRQAHETAIHRSDVEVAAGTPPRFDAELAADGIDELLVGFYGRRRGRLVADPPRTLRVQATDTDREWTLVIRPDGREVRRDGAGPADCVIAGPAGSVYPYLWNRTVTDPPRVSGDLEVHRLWRDLARVGWS